jgi:hypothetical protein
VLCGGPGTGKTFVTKRLAHMHRMAEPPLPLVLSASTGAAAIRLSRFAGTNHTRFLLPTRGQPRFVPAADPLRAAVHAKATFILDEFSMMTRDQLHMVLMRLQSLGGYYSITAMLKHIKVVLVGDDKQVGAAAVIAGTACMAAATVSMQAVFHALRARHCCPLLLSERRQAPCHSHAPVPSARPCTTVLPSCASHSQSCPARLRMQLPPVCYCKNVNEDDVCGVCHIINSPYLNPGTDEDRALVHVYQLKTSVRHQADLPFSTFLNIIRDRRPTQHELDAILPPQYWMPSEDVVAACVADPTTTILCTHREDVARYNDQVLEQLSAAGLVGPVHRTPLATNARDVTDMHEWLSNPYHHPLRSVAVGARVMITSNIDMDLAAANGACGVVEAIKVGDDGHPCSLVVRLDLTGKAITLRRTLVHIYYGPDKAKYYKGSFPCMLAYALTGHKSQGATLTGPTIVHVRHSFAPGLLYVMLSRVTSREKLKVVAPLTLDSFTPVTHGAGALTANDWSVLHAQLQIQAAAMRAPMDQ